MKKKISVLILIMVLIFTMVACGNSSSGDDSEQTYTLRFAHGSSTSEPIHLAAEYMAEQLKERSNGRVTMEIYPSATLADQVPACEMMMDGTSVKNCQRCFQTSASKILDGASTALETPSTTKDRLRRWRT